MKCPACHDATLVTADRQGIEIDYCPECRGIWLDRGELEKIIERSVKITDTDTAHPAPARPAKPEHKQKRNLITELFDF